MGLYLLVVNLQCPGCKMEFKALGKHYRYYPEHRPEITEEKAEILRGIWMGDGCVADNLKGNPYMMIEMINREFLEHLSEEFHGLHTGLRSYESDTCKDGIIYRLRSVNHEWFKQFVGCSVDGEHIKKKSFPDDTELTPTIVKYWYACDGSLLHRKETPGARPRSQIGCKNEEERPDFLIDLFEDVGFSPKYYSGRLRFGVDDTERLVKWMGEAPPGFEYKFDLQKEM